MRIFFSEISKSNARALNFDASNAQGPQGRVHWTSSQIQASALGVSYSRASVNKFMNLIHKVGTQMYLSTHYSFTHVREKL